ncbi:hypothetical protein L7F22_000733 [Adiantum nelumboides]|nr:hypothetical protein [Adiantum nelumboides]
MADRAGFSIEGGPGPPSKRTWSSVEFALGLLGFMVTSAAFVMILDYKRIQRSNSLWPSFEQPDFFRPSPDALLFVRRTIVEGAVEKGAVCLDGSPPAYHLHRGRGLGINNWLIHLEGGGWCSTHNSCFRRSGRRLGSSHYMDEQVVFGGSLSNSPLKNPGRSSFVLWTSPWATVIEEASRQPMLRDPKNIEHKFTEETLKLLKIDEDGFLTDEEIKCVQEMLKKHGKAFAFERVLKAHLSKLIDLLNEKMRMGILEPSCAPYSSRCLEEEWYLKLERCQEDIEQVKEKLKVACLKSKAAFDDKHRLRPYVIKDGDWVLVYDSSLENQHTAMRKMVKRWFRSYVVFHAYDNATYKLCELDGCELKVPIAGKRIKLFKKREGEFVHEGQSLDQLPRNEVYASDDALDEAD